MNISRQIESLLKKYKVSRFKLSKDTGIPYTTLTQIINGRTKDPQVKALEIIADYFNEPLDYILGKSVGALIENQLKNMDKSWEWLSHQTNIPVGDLQSIDSKQPNPSDFEENGIIDRISKALTFKSNYLAVAYARQESPLYDGPPRTRSLAEIFDPNHNTNELETAVTIKEMTLETKTIDVAAPTWASSKDKRDFKKMLEDDLPVMFDGVPIEGEARQRVMDVLTGLFWEAKEMNKKTYGRKKNNKTNTTEDSKE